MEQQEIHSYLRRFFTTAHCEIMTDTNEYMTVQLTIDMDKMLMNRPYYWHYIEKTGGEPNPQKLTMIFDAGKIGDLQGELLHFGSPRLHQIFSAAKKYGRFIRLFEDRPGTVHNHTPLIPWVCLNLKISYICDRRKDMFRSLGVNLINGMFVEEFHQKILRQQVKLTAKIPDFSLLFHLYLNRKAESGE